MPPSDLWALTNDEGTHANVVTAVTIKIKRHFNHIAPPIRLATTKTKHLPSIVAYFTGRTHCQKVLVSKRLHIRMQMHQHLNMKTSTTKRVVIRSLFIRTINKSQREMRICI